MGKKSTTRRILTALGTGFFVFLVVILLIRTDPFQQLELRILDQKFEIRGPLSTAESPIVLVAISEQADGEIPHQWPWPREVHARLIHNLNEAGARAIGLDFTMSQPDRVSPRNDSLLAQALEQHDNVILAGNILVEVAQRSGLVSSSTQQQLIQPIPMFERANVNPMGLVSAIADDDGYLRRYRLRASHFEQEFLSFSIELLRVYLGLEELEIIEHDRYFEAGPYMIPKFDRHTMLINYHGGRGSFPEFSYELVIDDSTFTTVLEELMEEEFNDFYELRDAGVFEDKIVLVGATMLELQDFFSTPFAPRGTMPGYEMHANALQTILSERFIRTMSNRGNILIVFVSAMLTSFLTAFTGVLLGVVLIVSSIVGFILLTFYLFIEHDYHLLMTGPLLAIFIGYTGSVLYNYFSEQREKRRIKNMFGSYVSPELVDQMVNSEDEPSLGGNEVYITAFFSDIQSFSTFSEKLTPIQLVDLINEYLTAMTNILNDERGTLDKYIGDAIVAFFGAPVEVEDHAYRACIASQKMLMKQAELRHKWSLETEKWPDLVGRMQTRIGVNTGEMVTGNMGSETRFNYTMMGDNVNLAARCESGAKAYGVYCMITETTKTEAEKYGNECVFRYLDKIVVKGRTQPVKMYEIVGLRSYLSETVYECVRIFEDGIDQYLNQNWDKALELFDKSAKLEPNQPDEKMGITTNPSLVMIERCHTMKANPPAENWDGIYVMTSK